VHTQTSCPQESTINCNPESASAPLQAKPTVVRGLILVASGGASACGHARPPVRRNRNCDRLPRRPGAVAQSPRKLAVHEISVLVHLWKRIGHAPGCHPSLASRQVVHGRRGRGERSCILLVLHDLAIPQAAAALRRSPVVDGPRTSQVLHPAGHVPDEKQRVSENAQACTRPKYTATPVSTSPAKQGHGRHIAARIGGERPSGRRLPQPVRTRAHQPSVRVTRSAVATAARAQQLGQEPRHIPWGSGTRAAPRPRDALWALRRRRSHALPPRSSRDAGEHAAPVATRRHDVLHQTESDRRAGMNPQAARSLPACSRPLRAVRPVTLRLLRLGLCLQIDFDSHSWYLCSQSKKKRVSRHERHSSRVWPRYILRSPASVDRGPKTASVLI
jgi:hypothetical protein